MRRHLVLGALLLGAANGAHAAGLDFALGSETAQANLFFGSDAIGYGGADFSLGLFFNEDDDVMGSFGVKATGSPAGARPFSFGVGVKGYAASLDRPDLDVQALGIGGEVKYHIPANMPMALVTEAYYAPSITTGGDGDNFLDFNLNFELEITPGTAAFVGYRLLQTELETSGRDYELDDAAHVGIRLMF
ncbi:MAG TPA: hypothetical protein ENN42_09440 [Thioalkalivibrio sp.]|nr:hypothetical protein [Thioalkalivibrio sp.]